VEARQKKHSDDSSESAIPQLESKIILEHRIKAMVESIIPVIKMNLWYFSKLCNWPREANSGLH
jgi:hypothetical protein